MAKYDPLRDHLKSCGDSVEMTFDQIADLVGGLPASAFNHPAWWNNGDSTHSHSRSWGAAGYQAEPDLAAQTVRFRLHNNQVST